MLDQSTLYQTFTFIACVVVFSFLEFRRPGFAINKMQDIYLNILALLVVIFAGEYVKTFITYGFDTIDMKKIFSQNYFSGFPSFVKIIIAIILTDFALYWVHKYMHRPLLWRTHTFHHSIKQLWWLAGSRTSVIHLLLYSVPQVLIGYYFLQLNILELTAAYSFGIVVNIWIHSNIWVTIKPIDWLLITPNYHRIHHGSRGFGVKNLGAVFTIWDRIFKTYINPGTVEKDFPLFAVPTQKHLIRMIIGF